MFFVSVLTLVCTNMVGWNIPIFNRNFFHLQKGHVFFVCHLVVRMYDSTSKTEKKSTPHRRVFLVKQIDSFTRFLLKGFFMTQWESKGTPPRPPPQEIRPY